MNYYTWDELYERAMDKGYGSDELTAKDEARFELGDYILETEGYDIEDVSIYESAEEEIDFYLQNHTVLFNEYGNIVVANGEQFGWKEEYDGILVWRRLCA